MEENKKYETGKPRNPDNEKMMPRNPDNIKITQMDSNAGSITIDDLICNIFDTEAPDLPGYMEKEQQARIETRIMEGIRELQEKEKDWNMVRIKELQEKEKATEIRNRNDATGKRQEYIIQTPPKKRKKGFLVFGLAAVLLLGLCLSVFASTNPDWDMEILTFMGLAESTTFQLESGEVEIQVYDSCQAIEYKRDSGGKKITSPKEVKIMAVNSIGDRNSACIRIETDYELPEGFVESTDYIMPENYSLNVYEKPGKFVESGMGATTGYVNMDGKLGYMIYITGCKGLNRCQVNLRFENFYWHHDLGMEEGGQEKELLLEGSWEITWKYAYKANTKTYKMLKPIRIDGVRYYITNIEVSPLSVQIDGFRMPWDREKEFDGFTIDRICYKDGTSLEVGGWSSAGNNSGIWLETFLGTTEMKTTIDVEKIDCIVFGGNEIWLK